MTFPGYLVHYRDRVARRLQLEFEFLDYALRSIALFIDFVYRAHAGAALGDFDV